MNKLFLLFIFAAFSAKAEYQAKIEITKHAKEAINLVQTKIDEENSNLILHGIEFEYTDASGEVTYDFDKYSLKNKTYLVFHIVDINSKISKNNCDEYHQHIVKLLLDKTSRFIYSLGEYNDCSDKRDMANDILK